MRLLTLLQIVSMTSILVELLVVVAGKSKSRGRLLETLLLSLVMPLWVGKKWTCVVYVIWGCVMAVLAAAASVLLGREAKIEIAPSSSALLVFESLSFLSLASRLDVSNHFSFMSIKRSSINDGKSIATTHQPKSIIILRGKTWGSKHNTSCIIN